MTLAAIYSRYSSDRQSEASSEDQVPHDRLRFAEARGWTTIAETERDKRQNPHLRLAGYRDPGMVAAAFTLRLGRAYLRGEGARCSRSESLRAAGAGSASWAPASISGSSTRGRRFASRRSCASDIRDFDRECEEKAARALQVLEERGPHYSERLGRSLEGAIHRALDGVGHWRAKVVALKSEADPLRACAFFTERRA